MFSAEIEEKRDGLIVLTGIEGIEAEDLESLFEQFEGGMVVHCSILELTNNNSLVGYKKVCRERFVREI